MREEVLRVSDPNVRSLWLALAFMVGALVAVSAGILYWISGASAPSAVLAGGGAFGAAVLFLLSVIRFATGDSE
jgi:hypothetical protein